MKATPLVRIRIACAASAYAELFLQRHAGPGGRDLEYRLSCVVRGERVLHYRGDSGAGRRYANGSERAYAFTTPEKLMADFWRDVARCIDENGDA